MVSTGQFAVGVIGNIISMGLFLSTLPTFRKIWRNKTTGEYSAVPYAATFLNCILWLFYGSPFVKMGILILTINGAGACIEAVYLIIFILYARDTTTRRNVFIMIFVVVILYLGVVLVNMLAFSAKATREVVVGVLCVVFNSSMYFAPLTIMRTVIRTKSTKFMPLPLSIFNFLNGLVWTIYGIMGRDKFIMIPNGLGVFFSVCQLILYGCYCGNSNAPTDHQQNLENMHSIGSISGRETLPGVVAKDDHRV